MPPFDFKNASPEQFKAYVQKLVDEAVKKDSATRKADATVKEKVSKLYEKDVQNLGTIAELTTTITNQQELYRKSLQSLAAEGAFFVRGGPLQTGLNETIKSLDELLARPEAGAAAFRSLTTSLKNFAQIAEAAQDANGGIAASLTEQAAVLKELGLSYGNFNKNVDFAIYSMGQSRTVVEGLNTSLMDLSKSIGMLPDDVSRNFQMVAKNLAYDFETIKVQFVKIQKLSAETGVSIDNLMGKFGQPMDTIAGASQMAAKINALLGRNAFSATELLTMDEETRMTSIRGALMQDGLDQQALEGGLRGKFTLQSINEVLGLGMDDTRRFLQTGGLKGKVAEKVREDFDDGGMERFKDASEKSADALTRFTDTLLSFMKVSDEQAIRSRAESLRSPGILAGLGVFAKTGETSGINSAMEKSLGFRAVMNRFNQDKKKAEDLGITRESLRNLAARINAGGPAGAQAAQEAESLKIMLGSQMGIRDGFSPLKQSLISLAPEEFGFKMSVIDELRNKSDEQIKSKYNIKRGPDGKILNQGGGNFKFEDTDEYKKVERNAETRAEQARQATRQARAELRKQAPIVHESTTILNLDSRELGRAITEHLIKLDPKGAP